MKIENPKLKAFIIKRPIVALIMALHALPVISMIIIGIANFSILNLFIAYIIGLVADILVIIGIMLVQTIMFVRDVNNTEPKY
jgi:hypothetical protein